MRKNLYINFLNHLNTLLLPAYIRPKILEELNADITKDLIWLIRGRVAGAIWSDSRNIVTDKYEKLHFLKNAGISHFICLVDTPFTGIINTSFDVKIINFSFNSVETITLNDAWIFCHELDKLIKENATVAVYCEKNLSFSSAMLAIYLIWINQQYMCAEQALSYIRALNFRVYEDETYISKIQLFAEILQLHRTANKNFENL